MKPKKEDVWLLIKVVFWVGLFGLTGYMIANINNDVLRLLATVGICVMMSLLITVNVK